MKALKTILTIIIIVAIAYFALVAVNRFMPNKLPKFLQFGSWIDNFIGEDEDETDTESEAESDETSDETEEETESKDEFEEYEAMLTKKVGPQAYVERLYVYFLERRPSESELKEWTDSLIDGTVTAGDVASTIIRSDEFLGKTVSPERYVKLLYRGLYKRDFDKGIPEAWAKRQEDGISKIYVLKSFVDAPEFKRISSSYGLEQGTVALKAERDLHPDTTYFVQNMYRELLGRSGSHEELDDWSEKLATLKVTGAKMAKAFALGDEYNARNRSDEEFAGDIYRAFLKREASAEELEDIKGKLADGTSRDAIIDSLVKSDEFADICRGAGFISIIRQSSTIDPSKPMVALTFDDGPSNSVTPIILDVLEEYNAHATFFVVGTMLGSSTQDVLKREIALGCEIANHTQKHSKLTTISAAAVAEQVKYVEDKVLELTGVKPTLVRPPYGSHNETARNAAGVPFILWNIDTLDWSHKNSQKTYNNIMGSVKDGDIILMHDIHAPTAEAVKMVVPALIAKGYQLVTVSEMAQYKGYNLQSGHYYYSLP